MPARTLNSFFAGFFYTGIETRQEAGRGIMCRGQGNGGVKVIKVEGRREKEKEVIVCHEVVSSKWKMWSHDIFSRNWNKNYSVIPLSPLQALYRTGAGQAAGLSNGVN
jgi:hypothetical protein